MKKLGCFLLGAVTAAVGLMAWLTMPEPEPESSPSEAYATRRRQAVVVDVPAQETEDGGDKA